MWVRTSQTNEHIVYWNTWERHRCLWGGILEKAFRMRWFMLVWNMFFRVSSLLMYVLGKFSHHTLLCWVNTSRLGNVFGQALAMQACKHENKSLDSPTVRHRLPNAYNPSVTEGETGEYLKIAGCQFGFNQWAPGSPRDSASKNEEENNWRSLLTTASGLYAKAHTWTHTGTSAHSHVSHTHTHIHKKKNALLKLT